MIDATIDAIKHAWSDPTADEVADLLWLAHKIHQAGPLPQSAQQSAEQLHESLPTSPSRSSSPPTPSSKQRPVQLEPEGEPVGNIFPETSSEATGPMSGMRGIPFSSPAASALPGVLELGRAIRPLLRRVPSTTESAIDEEATIELLVEQGLLSVVLRPLSSRWLAVDLVVDESASMVIWRQTIVELRRFLERHGAFRDVRVWGMQTDATTNTVQLYARKVTGGDQRPRSPKELTDPSGRRLILVVSDCVSPVWHNGNAFALLQTWGERMPVTIVQMLPRRLWSETALGKGRSAELYATLPGTPNTQLRAELRYKRSSRRSSIGLKLPVITLEPNSLILWARMLAGTGGAAAPGFVFRADLSEFAEDLSDSETTTQVVGKAQSDADALLVQNFREAASPTAWKLAGYFAAAPLTLPVMRLVQHTMLPQPLSRQVHLAEVFLGGLLRQVTPSSKTIDPERVRYDFVTDRVRDLLLNTLDAPDAIAVLRSAVSEFVEERAGHTFDFDAILADPDAAATMPISEQLTPFANVAAKVLRRLGGRYMQAAEHLSGSGTVRVRPRTTRSFVEVDSNEEGIGDATSIEMLVDDNHAQEDSQTDEYTNLGDDYYAQKQYEEAIIAYQQAIAFHPEDVQAHIGLGNVYRDLKRYEDAIIVYQRAIEIDPSDAKPYAGLANAYRNLNRFEDALATYQKAIELDPNATKPHNGLGNVYRVMKRYEEAINAYQQVIAIDPTYTLAYSNLGRVYHELKRYEEAINAYQQAIAIDPKDVQSLISLGNVYRQTKQYEKAIAVYEQAAVLDSTNIFLYNGLGNVYQDLKRYEEAIAAYQQAISFDPTSALPHNGLGLVYHRLKRYHEAITTYEHAISLNPHFTRAHTNLGYVYLDLKRYEEAIAAYQRAISLDPEYAGPYNGLGVVYQVLKQYEEAIAIYQQAIALEPNFAYPHSNLGNVYRIQKRYEEAIASYQQAITFEPTAAYLHNGLGFVYCDEKRYEEAIATYRQAIALDPKSAYLYNNLGLVYRYMKQYDEAISTYQQAVALDPSYTRAYAGLGIVYRYMKRYDEAIIAHQQAIALDPTAAYLYVNLGRVYTSMERYDEAITAYQQAIALEPDYAPAYTNLGNLYRDLKRYDEAIIAHHQAVQLAPDVATAQYDLGRVYHRLERYEEVVVAYQQAIALDPNIATAQASLAGIYRLLGRSAEYEQQLEVARPLIANENEYNRACFESICGNLDEALALLAVALEKEQVTLDWARNDPDFIFIRDDPRFQALVREQSAQAETYDEEAP